MCLMLPDERDKVYKCTIVDFSLSHKFAPDSSPRKAFKMQEMGIDGTGSHEESDLASTLYWIDYPLPFLRFYYDTFPAVDDGRRLGRSGRGGIAGARRRQRRQRQRKRRLRQQCHSATH